MIELSFFLYYKPCPDMGIEGKENFDIDILREHGKDLASYLSKIADYLTVLKEQGWSYYGGLYDINCYKETTKNKAIAELNKLKINLNAVNLIELDKKHECSKDLICHTPLTNQVK